MTLKSLRRVAFRLIALLAVVLIAAALAPGTGVAQEDPPPTTSTPPASEEPAQPEEPSQPAEPAPESSEPAPEPEEAQVEPSEPAESDAASPREPVAAEDDYIRLDNVDVVAALDKTAYSSGDLVTVTLKVTNNGAASIGPLTDDTCCELDIRDRGKLDDLAVGIDLGPGESFETTFAGYMSDIDGDVFRYDVAIVGPPNDEGVSDFKSVELSAAVTRTTGEYSGTVYADKNDNGALDAGEPLAGVTVELHGGVPFDSLSRTTGADGRFTFIDIPTGPYAAQFAAPDGWYVTLPDDDIIVAEGDNPDATFRAVRPLAERLEAEIAFGKTSYALDHEVGLQVTLTNTGPVPLDNITANCNRIGNSNQLFADDDWGALASTAEGVTVEAGESVTVDIVTSLPSGAEDAGYIVASCDFVRTDRGIHEGPHGFDSANVAGISGELEGKFVHPSAHPESVSDKPIADVRFSLVDLQSGKAVTRGVSDDDGEFEVSGIPANYYRLQLRDGWRFGQNDATSMLVSVDRQSFGRWHLALVGGPDGASGGSAGGGTGDSGGSGAAASGDSGDGLALTGFNTAEYVMFGVLLLAGGAAAMSHARRRRLASFGLQHRL